VSQAWEWGRSPWGSQPARTRNAGPGGLVRDCAGRCSRGPSTKPHAGSATGGGGILVFGLHSGRLGSGRFIAGGAIRRPPFRPNTPPPLWSPVGIQCSQEAALYVAQEAAGACGLIGFRSAQPRRPRSGAAGLTGSAELLPAVGLAFAGARPQGLRVPTPPRKRRWETRPSSHRACERPGAAAPCLAPQGRSGPPPGGFRGLFDASVDVTSYSRAGNAISNEPCVPLSR
jgi:hypothetical protein